MGFGLVWQQREQSHVLPLSQQLFCCEKSHLLRPARAQMWQHNDQIPSRHRSVCVAKRCSIDNTKAEEEA